MTTVRRPLPILLLTTCLLLLPIPAIPLQNDAPPIAPVSATSQPVTIALLHMYDSVSFFARLGALTAENKARYAARHGYDFVQSTPRKTSGILRAALCDGRQPDASGRCWEDDKDFDIDHTRAPTFGKIKLALSACRGRDNGWLLWSDADAMIVNQTVPLEAIIDDAFDIMLAYDWLMLNAGVLLLKCSPWTIAFLQHAYTARKFDRARALDQSSIQEHLDNLTTTERNQHVKIVPKYAINVYAEEYRPGDFLLHMAGKLYEATEPGLWAIANQFDVLSMVDDVEDIEAFFRGKRLLNYYSGTCKVEAGVRQSACPPEDSRRIILNESLGSMSYPNRYRHVGLRYYWLGNWKDKYDVPGWDVKVKPLPLLKRRISDMPAVPPASLHHIDPHQNSVDTNNLAVKLKEDPPDQDHDAGVNNNDKVRDSRDDDKDGDDGDGGDKDDDDDDTDDDDDDDDDKWAASMKGRKNIRKGDTALSDGSDKDNSDGRSWHLLVWILLGLAAAVGGITVVLQRRKKMFSKIQ